MLYTTCTHIFPCIYCLRSGNCFSGNCGAVWRKIFERHSRVFYGLRLTKTKFRPLIWVLCQNIIDNFNDNLSKCHHFMARTRWFDLSRSACVILAYNWRKVTVLIAASKIDENLTIILKSLPQFSPDLLNEFHFIQIAPVLIIFICRREGEVLQCRDLNFRHLKRRVHYISPPSFFYFFNSFIIFL